MIKRTLFFFLLLVLISPVVAFAQEPSTEEVEDEISELKKIIEEQKEIIEDLSARIAALEEKLAQVAKKQEEAKPAPPWTEKLKISGDYRFRFEGIDEEGKKFRQRDRMRLRLGIGAKVNEQVDVGIRLATGGFDPISTNQTFGTAFSTKDFGLDLAYFDWHPSESGSVHVMGGKMVNPFYIPGGSQLIWDSDLTPEGVALKLSGTDEQTKPFLNASYLWAEERGAAADSKVLSLQGGISHTTKSGSSITLGAGVHNYTNMKGFKGLVDPTKGYGNTMVPDPDPAVKDVYYANDFNEFELFGEFGFNAGKTPASLYGNYVTNTNAPADDTGYLYGISFGKLKEPGSFSFGWEYRRVEKDAVVGAFNDSDFIGGGTNGKGHKFSFSYQLSKNAAAGVTYFVNEKVLDDPKDYRRWQIDFSFKF